MGDIAKVNTVEAADIASVNSVAKADIAKIGTADLPAGGATLWTIVGADGAVATAAHADLNAWTGYVSADMSTSDYNAISFGKDGSAAPLWVAVDDNGTKEIRYSSDPTGTAGWSNANVTGKQYAVLWGNNVWISVGQNGTLYRSTDGASWSAVDMSGATGWYTTGVDVRHLASDGAGTWMCDNHDFIFKSTDDGATWAKVYDTADAPLSDDDYRIRGIAYTVYGGTARWVVLTRKSSNTRVIHATAADTSSWTLATLDGGTVTGQNLIAHTNRHIAAAAGTVIMAVGDNISRSTDGGQDWTYTSDDGNDLPRTDAKGLATDGNGTWVVVHDSGRVSVSTSDGAPGSWAEQTGVQDGGSNTNLRFPTGGANVENLDAVCADVLLPV